MRDDNRVFYQSIEHPINYAYKCAICGKIAVIEYKYLSLGRAVGSKSLAQTVARAQLRDDLPTYMNTINQYGFFPEGDAKCPHCGNDPLETVMKEVQSWKKRKYFSVIIFPFILFLLFLSIPYLFIDNQYRFLIPLFAIGLGFAIGLLILAIILPKIRFSDIHIKIQIKHLEYLRNQNDPLLFPLIATPDRLNFNSDDPRMKALIEVYKPVLQEKNRF